MTTNAWRALQDEPGYKVYKTGRSLFRYTITCNGGVVNVASTLRGAKRVIRKDIRERSKEHPKFWEAPIVHKEPA